MIKKVLFIFRLLSLVVLIITALAFAGTFSMQSNNVVFAENSATVQNVGEDGRYESNYDSVESQSLFASQQASTAVKNIYNITIFIKFTDTDETQAETALEDSLKIYSNSDSEIDSIRGYYKSLTNDKIVINNCFAYTDQATTNYFVYEAPGTMLDFQNTDTTSSGAMSANRVALERQLLSGALAAYNASYKGSYVDADFDFDDNGLTDSVCFVILEKSSTKWGSLMWPHKSNLEDIGVTDSININGQSLKGGDYTLSFAVVDSGRYNFAVACHEMGHVFGAKDYYSYDENGDDYYYARYFDLMGNTSFDTQSPPFMTAYTLDKYLKVNAGDIKTIYKRQEVTLTAATEATDEDIVAVKIPTNISGVYIMAEFRTNTSSTTYDQKVGGSGVIVYRVNENVNGNIYAENLDDFNDIELLVYNCQTSASSAFLDVKDEFFDNCTLTSGTKLDITITLTEIVGNKATISISGPGLRDDSPEPTPNDYFDNKVEVTTAEYIFDEANELFGVKTIVKVKDIDMAKLTTMTLSLLDVDDTVVHTMTASRGALLTYSGTTASFEVFFDYLGGGDLQWFSGYRLSKAKPYVVTLTVVDTDEDVIPISTIGTDGKKFIDNNGYVWTNIYKVADMYDVTILATTKPYIEVAVGNTFSLGSFYILPNTGQHEISLTYSLPAGLSTSGSYIVGDTIGIYTITVKGTYKGKEVATHVTVVVMETINSYTTVSLADSSIVELLGTDWQDLQSKVLINGVSVNIADTECISYSAYAYRKSGSTYYLDAGFRYEGNYYQASLKVKDQIAVVNLSTQTFNLFKGETIDTATQLTIYFKGGAVKTFAISELYRYGISISYDISNFSGTQYKEVEYTVTYDGVSVKGIFNFFRISVVEDSIVAEGQQKITVDGATYFVGNYTAGNISLGDFKVNFTITTGDGEQSLYADATTSTYVLTGLPTTSGDKTNVTVTLKYVKDSTNVVLGNLILNFRILKSADRVEVTSVQAGKVSVAAALSNAVVFYLDEYYSGALNFQYVIYYDGEDTQYVPFVLSDKVTIKEGLFSFVSTEWGLDATLYFYGVDFVTDITVPGTAYYGETLVSTYPAKTFLERNVEVDTTILNFDNRGTVNSAQSVEFIVTYNSTYLPYARTKSFIKSIKLVDGVYQLKKATLTMTSFNYGEQVDWTHLTLLTYITYYNHHNGIDSEDSANPKEATFSTLNYNLLTGTTRSIDTQLVITYQEKDITVDVKLINGIKEVRLPTTSDQANGILYIEQDTSHIYYLVKYDNGEQESISIALSGAWTTIADSATVFVADDIGEYRVLVKNPNLATEELTVQKIFVYKNVDSVNGLYDTKGNVIGKITLKYGEPLNLTDYIVKYTDNGIDGEIKLKRNYYQIDSNKYCTMVGETFINVKLSILSVSSSRYSAATEAVQVKVLKKVDKEVLSVVEDKASLLSIDHTRGIIMLNGELKVADLKTVLTSDPRFTINYPSSWAYENAGGYVVKEGKKQGYIVKVVNSEKVEIAAFQVVLDGDANGNAINDIGDIDSFAKALVNGADEYINCFSDGDFSLEDFVKKILDRKNQGDATPMALARLFVCDYKGREDEV